MYNLFIHSILISWNQQKNPIRARGIYLIWKFHGEAQPARNNPPAPPPLPPSHSDSVITNCTRREKVASAARPSSPAGSGSKHNKHPRAASGKAISARAPPCYTAFMKNSASPFPSLRDAKIPIYKRVNGEVHALDLCRAPANGKARENGEITRSGDAGVRGRGGRRNGRGKEQKYSI